jgi:predicted DNA-binding ArsR family transcriptional regulator
MYIIRNFSILQKELSAPKYFSVHRLGQKKEKFVKMIRSTNTLFNLAHSNKYLQDVKLKYAVMYNERLKDYRRRIKKLKEPFNVANVFGAHILTQSMI